MAKIIITLLFLSIEILAFGQNSIESIGDSNLYRHTYIYHFVTESDTLVIKWNNGNKGITDIKNNSTGKRVLSRYDKEGRKTLILKDYFTSEKVEGNQLRYCISGEVITFYKNGEIRTRYKLDESFLDSDGYKIFNWRGKLIETTYFKGIDVFHGNDIRIIDAETIRIDNYNKGVLTSSLILDSKLKKVYKLINEERKKLCFSARKFKVFSNKYSLNSVEKILNPI